MKTTILALAAVCIGLSSCNQKIQPVPLQPPQPAPTVTPPSAARVEVLAPPAEGATPARRLAPSGTLFVVKRFAVSTTNGLHGFSVGKRVTIVREEPGSYIVTDGVAEGRAPTDSVTNDLDLADAAVKEGAKPIQKLQTPAPQVAQAHSVSTAAAAQQADVIAADKKRKQISEMETALQGLKSRVAKARSEREQKGYPADGGPRYYHGHNRTVVSLSQDAGNIERLTDAAASMERQLQSLK